MMTGVVHVSVISQCFGQCSSLFNGDKGGLVRDVSANSGQLATLPMGRGKV